MLCPTCNAQNPDTSLTCTTCATPLGGGQAVAWHTLTPGVKLGGALYSVGKVLGQGGFGITYQGSDLRLRRPVAIKEFFPQGCVRQSVTVQPAGTMTGSAYASAKSKFLEEARTLAQFQHPAIVHVYTTFEENNTAYMVMEFLKGKSLGDLLLERGAFSEERAVNYIERVGDALKAVHAANLLHRDIKPDNIMLTDEGRVVLVDFGTARAFTVGQTQHLTSAFLTQGYAPLEQYGREQRFGPWTDLYALGATLYHLLTGQVPIPATDRSAGVNLSPPRRLNAGVSVGVSDAVMWAMETKMDKRPQKVDEFLSALRGVTNTPKGSGGRGRTSTGTPQPRVSNPYEPRIQQVLADLAKPPPPAPPSAYDARIQELTNKLHVVAQFSVGQATLCPACRRTNLTHATGQPDGRCPLCRNGRMAERKLDVALCPVCRAGRLADHKLDEDICFCPVCRQTPVQKERRKHFGLALDLWWVCPGCKAEFDVITGGKAKLVRLNQDPYGMTRFLGQVLPISNWKRISTRSDEFTACGSCAAQFDRVDGELTLAAYRADPHGVGAKHKGVKLSRTAWAKIAQGIPPSAGNFHCPQCRAEFDYDHTKKVLCLNHADSAPAWAQQWRGRSFPLTAWYLAAAGKRSLRPGLLCSSCKSEFDDDQGRLKLVSVVAGALTPMVGQTRSLWDWHRRAANLPSESEEAQLRSEQSRLLVLRQQEQANTVQAQQQHYGQLLEQLKGLYKQSILGGHVPLKLSAPRAKLRPGEVLRWQSAADKWKMRSNQGTYYWDLDAPGTLLVTTERIMFDSSAGGVWQKPLGKVEGMELQHVRRGYGGSTTPVLVLQISELLKPVGFALDHATWEINAQGQKIDVSLTGTDLMTLLSSLR